MKVFLIAAGLIFFILPAQAWDGTDQDGNQVEIDTGNTVRSGNDIEINQDGETKTFSVDSVQRFGNSVEIDGTDEDGNSSTLTMDGDQ